MGSSFLKLPGGFMKKTLFNVLVTSLFLVELLVVSVVAQGFEAKDGKIFIPIEDISTTASYYTLGEVKIFVVMNSSGGIVTHQDACQACGPVGFLQNGTAMKCNGCGLQYEIDNLGVDKQGSCWPYYISNRTEGDLLVLDQAEIGVDLNTTGIFNHVNNSLSTMKILGFSNLEGSIVISKSGNYTLSLFSVSGKNISEITKSYSKAGNYSVRLLNRSLAKGEYLLTLKSNDNLITKKIVIK